jgi:MarR family 2-MHQ and catechol resistance regulon transcriptional repressor
MARAERTDPMEHPYLTTIGLLLESAAGVERTFGQRLEHESGMSLQWFEVLLRLARTPGGRLRMSDLAGQLTLSTSGLTRCVDRLEEAGLVRREPCDTDGRVAYAVLTAPGRRQINAAVAGHVAHLDEVLGTALSPAELDSLNDALRTLRSIVNPEAAHASECPPAAEAPD